MRRKLINSPFYREALVRENVAVMEKKKSEGKKWKGENAR